MEESLRFFVVIYLFGVFGSEEFSTIQRLYTKYTLERCSCVSDISILVSCMYIMYHVHYVSKIGVAQPST